MNVIRIHADDYCEQCHYERADHGESDPDGGTSSAVDADPVERLFFGLLELGLKLLHFLLVPLRLVYRPSAVLAKMIVKRHIAAAILTLHVYLRVLKSSTCPSVKDQRFSRNSLQSLIVI